MKECHLLGIFYEQNKILTKSHFPGHLFIFAPLPLPPPLQSLAPLQLLPSTQSLAYTFLESKAAEQFSGFQTKGGTQVSLPLTVLIVE